MISNPRKQHHENRLYTFGFCCRSRVSQSLTILIDHVNRCPRGQQHFDDLDMTIQRREMQSRTASLTKIDTLIEPANKPSSYVLSLPPTLQATKHLPFTTCNKKTHPKPMKNPTSAPSQTIRNRRSKTATIAVLRIRWGGFLEELLHCIKQPSP